MVINPRQKEFFDLNAHHWDTIAVHDDFIVNMIVNLLKLNGGESILDVGTGTGVMIPYYCDRLSEGRVISLDYSERMIDVAKKKFPPNKYPNVSFIVSDLYEYCPSERYDVIVCYSCFPHFPEKAKAISHLAYLLNPGGTFMISHGCSRDKINEVHREGGEVICNDYLPCMEEMTDLFEQCGLEVTFTRDDDMTFTIIGKL